MPGGAIKGSPWRDLYVHMLNKSTNGFLARCKPLLILGGLATFALAVPVMADVTYTYTDNEMYHRKRTKRNA